MISMTSPSTDEEKLAVDTSEAHNLDSQTHIPTSWGSFRSSKNISLSIPSTPKSDLGLRVILFAKTCLSQNLGSSQTNYPWQDKAAENQ